MTGNYVISWTTICQATFYGLVKLIPLCGCLIATELWQSTLKGCHAADEEAGLPSAVPGSGGGEGDV